MELRFGHNPADFYEKDGKLKEEPEGSLEELVARYDKAAKNFIELSRKMIEASRPYTRRRWINNVEPTFIEDSSRNYGHRTWANAEWADLTIAFAVDFTSPGEITTKKAAGNRYLAVPIPQNLSQFKSFDQKQLKMIERLKADIIAKVPCHKNGIKLNVAGNGATALKKCGITSQDDVDRFVGKVLNALPCEDIQFSEIRSGGQSGVDEAGIKAAQRWVQCRCSILAPKGFRMRDADGIDHEGREAFVDRFREEYVDYDEWDKKDPEGCLSYGLCEFNSFNALDEMQYDIDLKIMHINEREKKE